MKYVKPGHLKVAILRKAIDVKLVGENTTLLRGRHLLLPNIFFTASGKLKKLYPVLHNLIVFIKLRGNFQPSDCRFNIKRAETRR